MKSAPRFFILLCLVISSSNLLAQVGINTSSPKGSTVLEIASNNKGVLIPRVGLQSTTDVTTILNPTNSLLVFNNIVINDVTPGFYYWDLSYPKWVRWASNAIHKSVKYSVTNSTTNINVAQSGSTGVVAPVFGNLEWNDDTTLFQASSGTQVQVTKSGKYRIVMNAYINKIDPAHTGVAPEMQVLINGTRDGTLAVAKSMNSTTHSFTSLILNDVLYLTANDIIKIDTKASGSSTNPAYFVAGTPNNGYPSNITITYLGS